MHQCELAFEAGLHGFEIAFQRRARVFDVAAGRHPNVFEVVLDRLAKVLEIALQREPRVFEIALGGELLDELRADGVGRRLGLRFGDAGVLQAPRVPQGVDHCHSHVRDGNAADRATRDCRTAGPGKASARV